MPTLEAFRTEWHTYNARKPHVERRVQQMNSTALSHLDRLEAESIHILREVAAGFENPVMMYSVGKDSSVLLHLLAKAFHPARPPLPLLPVATGWNFGDVHASPTPRPPATGVTP